VAEIGEQLVVVLAPEYISYMVSVCVIRLAYMIHGEDICSVFLTPEARGGEGECAVAEIGEQLVVVLGPYTP
jgi:hypothetical protein